MPNLQLNKLKSRRKNIKVTFNLSSNINGISNDKNNFPHKLLLTDRLVLRLSKAFANNSSTNKKLSKT